MGVPNIPAADRDRVFPGLQKLIDGEVPVQQFADADMIVVGDPEQCVEKLKRNADLGVENVICYVQFGYHSHESTMRTIELLGKEVLPEIKAYTRDSRRDRV